MLQLEVMPIEAAEPYYPNDSITFIDNQPSVSYGSILNSKDLSWESYQFEPTFLIHQNNYSKNNIYSWSAFNGLF